MKEVLLSVSLMLILSSLFAQTIIPRAGITLSSSAYTPNSDFVEKTNQQHLTGFTVGVGYDLFINDRFSLQPEINFIQKGQKREDIAYPDNYEYKMKSEYRYNYLEVPVLVKVKFGGVTKFYLSAGPSIALGLGGNYKFTSTFGGLPLDEDVKSKIKFSDKPDDYDGDDIYVDNRLDAGVQVGAGALLFGKVTVDIRYGLGLTDIYKEYDSKNKVLQFSVGVPLNLF
ncbi:MAG: PorT family protein [Cyclobacteriaceae bacterium]|nr:PorT family protein [Cyclobacteriaceae bacterium]MBX2956953.1 PorT family protein [Cyclobacteriaceae bacterium]